MDAPTPDEVRRHSTLLTERYPSGSGDEGLEALIAVVAPLVGAITGRVIAGTEGEDVPVGMLELARQAIAMKAEQFATAAGTVEATEDAIDRSNLRSISAGSWSESYWGPAEMLQAKALDLNPLLHQILWALTTEEQKAEWLFIWDPAHAPGFSVIESFEYRLRPGGY